MSVDQITSFLILATQSWRPFSCLHRSKTFPAQFCIHSPWHAADTQILTEKVKAVHDRIFVEGIQKAIVDLIDEFKDEFPTILRLSQSNQKREPMQKTSKIRMAVALAKINRGTLIQGLNSISRSSKSVARLLQPQLACRLLELKDISHRLLREVNAPKQPLYNMQVRKGSLFEIISFPAKTALTSIIYASYAALIYLTVCVNAVLEKVKKILQEEESIRQNREESENLRKAFSEPVLSEPMFPEGEIKAKPYRSLPEKPDNISDCPKLPANKLSNKIQVLHSVFDQSTEMNE